MWVSAISNDKRWVGNEQTILISVVSQYKLVHREMEMSPPWVRLTREGLPCFFVFARPCTWNVVLFQKSAQNVACIFVAPKFMLYIVLLVTRYITRLVTSGLPQNEL